MRVDARPSYGNAGDTICHRSRSNSASGGMTPVFKAMQRDDVVIAAGTYGVLNVPPRGSQLAGAASHHRLASKALNATSMLRHQFQPRQRRTVVSRRSPIQASSHSELHLDESD